ncbi:hypothetical protein SLS62_011143 [Diatrype stigma]|uniref:HpcH/HpaI aldolase/citrate lyase domain-containing protein n=1 Tax=Diatrype stigma TaxID=117547 RepID=A0AAN9U4X6_9PEZI
MAATAKSSAILRRALLYVPASSPRMLTKSLGLTSDNVTYDLEDSVTPAAKPGARTALREHLAGLSLSRPPPGVSELAVRINAVSTPHALDDLTALKAVLPHLDAIVVPKVNSASDLTFVADVLQHLAPERQQQQQQRGSSTTNTTTNNKPPIKLIALIESARAVMNLREICTALPPPPPASSSPDPDTSTAQNPLSGLIFAAEDFALDLSLTRTPSLTEFLYARSAIATAARAFGVPSAIDLVCTSYAGEAGRARLEEECRGGRSLGFGGKQCIHPSQVETVQRLFGPGEVEVEWAVRVVVADGKAAAREGRGAFALDGSMIDAPVVGKARATVERARRCGFDVEALMMRWKDQEPE